MMKKRSWHGAAFIVESLLLVVFIAASFAIVLQMLGDAYEKSVASDRLANAVILAMNDAEEFSADPTQGPDHVNFIDGESGLVPLPDGASADLDGRYDGSPVYNVSREISEDVSDAGVMYRAHISVECGGDDVYALDTARYVARWEVA